MIVLDTNVVSELMKPAPDKTVEEWIAEHPSSSYYTTTITQAEILLGVELLPRGRRRSGLWLAADALFDRVLAGRILPFDGDAARALPELAARRRRMGQPIGEYDVLIAAIAVSRGADIATRDARPASRTAE